MSLSRNRKTIGIILLAAGLIGFAASIPLLSAWGYSTRPFVGGPMMWGNMMHAWNYGELKIVNGTVEKIEWMEIDLNSSGQEVEFHGPQWFWETIGLNQGDQVTAKGVFSSMMEMGQGWHQEFIPYELTVNGRTYGDANERIPVWMQS